MNDKYLEHNTYIYEEIKSLISVFLIYDILVYGIDSKWWKGIFLIIKHRVIYINSNNKLKGWISLKT